MSVKVRRGAPRQPALYRLGQHVAGDEVARGIRHVGSRVPHIAHRRQGSLIVHTSSCKRKGTRGKHTHTITHTHPNALSNKHRKTSKRVVGKEECTLTVQIEATTKPAVINAILTHPIRIRRTPPDHHKRGIRHIHEMGMFRVQEQQTIHTEDGSPSATHKSTTSSSYRNNSHASALSSQKP